MKIGIVNDMALAIEALRRAVSHDGRHQVIWTAKDGLEALALSATQKPDLILMDLIMPNMDGVEATRQIMSGNPCPILVVTADMGANANLVFEAMACGALDAIDTPPLAKGDLRANAAPLLDKIKSIGQRLLQEHAVRFDAPTTASARGIRPAGLIAIGASAGGPGALAIILAALPRNLDAAVVIVQHIDAVFVNGMAGWLNERSAIPVRLAAEDDRLQAGVVLLAGVATGVPARAASVAATAVAADVTPGSPTGTGSHLVLKNAAQLGYVSHPRESIYKPSIDVFFASVASHLRHNAVGVVLTGMGADGARGLKALRDRGHRTIAQDEQTSMVYGMPKAAVAVGAAMQVMPIQSIASTLAGIFGTRS